MKRFLLKARFSMSGLIALLFVFALAPVAAASPYAYVANQGSNTVSVINMGTNTVAATVGGLIAPSTVAVSPDGRWVYVTNYNRSGTVSVINTATNTVVANVAVGSAPNAVAVSPDGSRVYVANYFGTTVSVIDTATNKVVATVAVGSAPQGVAVSPDGSLVYVTNYNSHTVSVINAATNKVVATVAVGYGPQGVAVSPDGSRVYVTNAGSNSVSVINTATNTVVGTVTLPSSSEPVDVAVNPDGSRVYVTNDAGNTVSVIDTATNKVVATVAVGSSPVGIAVSPDGSRVYVANESNTSNSVSVINTATNTLVGSPVAVGTYPIGIAVGPGALIASNSSASGPAGEQISASVPTVANATSCTTSDALVESPSRGQVNFDNATGAFTYTPSSATYSGPDAFTWMGQAPSGCTAANSPTNPQSNAATVTFTINPRIIGLGSYAVAPGGSAQIPFTLVGTAPLTHTLASDNPAVLPPSGVTVLPAACGTVGHLSCTLAVTASAVPGTASVTMTATDPYGDTTKQTMQVDFSVKASGGSTTGSGGGGALSLLALMGLAGLIGLASLRRRRSGRR